MRRSTTRLLALVALALAAGANAWATSRAGAPLNEVVRTYRGIAADCSLDEKPFALQIVLDASIDADAVDRLIDRVIPPLIACTDTIVSASSDVPLGKAESDQNAWLLIAIYAGKLPASMMGTETVAALVRDHVSLANEPSASGAVLPIRYGNPANLLVCPGSRTELNVPSPARVDTRYVTCKEDVFGEHDRWRVVAFLGLDRFSSFRGKDEIVIDKNAYEALEYQLRKAMERYSKLLVD